MKENGEEDIKNIEEIIELSKEEIDAKDENITAILDIEDLISLEHILQDYKRVLKENEEKNKIIDLMAKVMIDSSICDYFIKEKCKNYAGENRKICDYCIKEYFENKVKEVK